MENALYGIPEIAVFVSEISLFRLKYVNKSASANKIKKIHDIILYCVVNLSKRILYFLWSKFLREKFSR